MGFVTGTKSGNDDQSDDPFYFSHDVFFGGI